MSLEPEVGNNIGPTNKNMNCDSWGTYESPNSSPTASLCNGGTLDGHLWAECPSREDCRKERNQRVLADARARSGRTHLPTVSPASQVRFVGGQTQRPFSGTTSSPAATTIPQRPVGVPAQIHKAESGNPYIDTPRVLAPTRPGMHSPTFLPNKKEHWATRLFKNMVQGAFNAFGWHIHDLTQHVDLFPYQDDEQHILPPSTPPAEDNEKR
jgi:hypothetical protein